MHGSVPWTARLSDVRAVLLTTLTTTMAISSRMRATPVPGARCSPCAVQDLIGGHAPRDTRDMLEARGKGAHHQIAGWFKELGR